MRDRRGLIIYVGKAKNLRRRVQSYFRPGARHPPKVRALVNLVHDIDVLPVKNEAESLLTEAALIKKHKPHFNILMRDDKRYLALRADPRETWPRLTLCRIVRDDGALTFGPFPSAPVVRAAKDFCEKRWGLRQCSAPVPDANTHRHCLARVIRRCAAPCLGEIAPADYRARFAEACEFLAGHRPAILDEVKTDMEKAAAKGDFEKAATLRDTLFALKDMTKSHFIRKTERRTREDAAHGLDELREALGLNAPPRVIECIDISNLFGTHNVASLVVAREGLPDARAYLRFRIRSFHGADDPRAMAEVVSRRFSKESSINPTRPLPDLVVCDGGITQLRAARHAVADLLARGTALPGVERIPFVGLAERLELVVFDDGRADLALPRDSQGLFVLTRLRDEAHRFAITYHRALRERTIRESVLDEIPGIGEAKKVKLLTAFKSLRGIARADDDAIAKAAGLSRDLAQTVRQKARSCCERG